MRSEAKGQSLETPWHRCMSLCVGCVGVLKKSQGKEGKTERGNAGKDVVGRSTVEDQIKAKFFLICRN